MTKAQRKYTDLHCHILPGIDDGAKNIATTLELLQLQQQQAVARIAFTPHFNCEKQTVPEFLAKRSAAAKQMVSALQTSGYHFRAKLGAEIYFTPRLPQLPLDKLCLQGTRFVLVELPVAYRPSWTKDVFYQMQLKGYIPMVAHIERYPYMMENPTRIYDLVNAGSLIQVNAASLLRDAKRVKLLCSLVEWNLVHVIATDTHSVHHRPPYMAQAMGVLEKRVGGDAVTALCKNADCIFAGRIPQLGEPHKPHSVLGTFR